MVGDGDAPISWAGTVFQTNSSQSNRVELSLWFSPGGQNYTDDFSLGYDACYLWPSQLTIESYIRGQSDNGSCLQTMNEECVNDMITATNLYSTRLTGSPVNLTANSLPSVCSQLASDLTTNFPASCKPFFNSTIATQPVAVFGGTPALGGPLTGNQSLVKESICTLNDTSNNNNEYHLMWTQYGQFSLPTYYLANYFVTPVITAFMPIANNQRPITLGQAKAFMNCGRTNVLNAGSLPVAPAPALSDIPGYNSTLTSTNSTTNSTASDSSSSMQSSAAASSSNGGGISGGAIGGIVVGVVLGLAIIAAAIWFFVLRKRRGGGTNGAVEKDGYGAIENRDTRQNSVEAPAQNFRNTRQDSVEAPSQNSIAEIGNRRSGYGQAGWKSTEAVEMPTYRNPVELPAGK